MSSSESALFVQVVSGLVIACITGIVAQYFGLVRRVGKMDRKLDRVIDYLRDNDPGFGHPRSKRQSRDARQGGSGNG